MGSSFSSIPIMLALMRDFCNKYILHMTFKAVD